VQLISSSDFKAVCEKAKKSVGKIVSKRYVENASGGQRIFLLEGETFEETVKIMTFWKIVENKQKIYELKAAVIEAYAEDFADRINALTDSFTVK